jgi:hypothetical protein
LPATGFQLRARPPDVFRITVDLAALTSNGKRTEAQGKAIRLTSVFAADAARNAFAPLVLDLAE